MRLDLSGSDSFEPFGISVEIYVLGPDKSKRVAPSGNTDSDDGLGDVLSEIGAARPSRRPPAALCGFERMLARRARGVKRRRVGPEVGPTSSLL